MTTIARHDFIRRIGSATVGQQVTIVLKKGNTQPAAFLASLNPQSIQLDDSNQRRLRRIVHHHANQADPDSRTITFLIRNGLLTSPNRQRFITELSGNSDDLQIAD